MSSGTLCSVAQRSVFSFFRRTVSHGIAGAVGVQVVYQQIAYAQSGEGTFQKDSKGSHIRIQVSPERLVLVDVAHKVPIDLQEEEQEQREGGRA